MVQMPGKAHTISTPLADLQKLLGGLTQQRLEGKPEHDTGSLSAPHAFSPARTEVGQGQAGSLREQRSLHSLFQEGLLPASDGITTLHVKALPSFEPSETVTSVLIRHIRTRPSAKLPAVTLTLRRSGLLTAKMIRSFSSGFTNSNSSCHTVTTSGICVCFPSQTLNKHSIKWRTNSTVTNKWEDPRLLSGTCPTSSISHQPPAQLCNGRAPARVDSGFRIPTKVNQKHGHPLRCPEHQCCQLKFPELATRGCHWDSIAGSWSPRPEGHRGARSAFSGGL